MASLGVGIPQAPNPEETLTEAPKKMTWENRREHLRMRSPKKPAPKASKLRGVFRGAFGAQG